MPEEPLSPRLLGRIAGLWRYPVKSMRGESMSAFAIDQRGVVGDRFYALENGEGRLGSGKSTKRFFQLEGLLDFAAATGADGVVIRFPDGRTMRAEDPAIDRALSAACGVGVTLAHETSVSYRDSAPLHLLSEAALGWLRARLPGVAIDARRFRPNLVVAAGTADGLVENAWLGRRLAIGDEVVVRVKKPTSRCVMVTQAQAELGAAPAILRTINGDAASCFGLYAEVLRPGIVRCGDALRFA